MKIELLRYKQNHNSTGGLLFVDGEFICYICEDGHREIKVPGKTRIPEGTYDLILRNAGGMNRRYRKKFSFHKGMLHIIDVPDFEWIYLHIGNEARHSEGCLLVGLRPNSSDAEDFIIYNSTDAYKRLYLLISSAIENNEKVSITIKDWVCLTQTPL